MKLLHGFEIVNIAEEYIVVPVGENTKRFRGIVVLNEAAAILLERMKSDSTIEELVLYLMDHYEVDKNRAYKDIVEMMNSLESIGVLGCD